MAVCSPNRRHGHEHNPLQCLSIHCPKSWKCLILKKIKHKKSFIFRIRWVWMASQRKNKIHTSIYSCTDSEEFYTRGRAAKINSSCSLHLRIVSPRTIPQSILNITYSECEGTAYLSISWTFHAFSPGSLSVVISFFLFFKISWLTHLYRHYSKLRFPITSEKQDLRLGAATTQENLAIGASCAPPVGFGYAPICLELFNWAEAERWEQLHPRLYHWEKNHWPPKDNAYMFDLPKY